MKSIEKFFDMPFNIYCGVLLREKIAKKLAKLLYKQKQEIKELLASDLSQIEVSDWTLAYPNDEQKTVYYYKETDDKEKIDRINVIEHLKLINYSDEPVFVAKGSEDAKNQYIEWYKNTHSEI